LANISCNQKAAELLNQCLTGAAWEPALVDELVRGHCDDALFRVVAEGLADRFEPRLCRIYDEIFAHALRVPIARRIPAPIRDYRRIFVLSRVTLGADVAVTSVILDAAKRRFPAAEIYLAGPRKNWELFAADERIQHLEVIYRRGAIADRVSHLPELRRAADDAETLVIDPDSRLTQLGLLPVGRNALFFESRSYRADTDESLAELTARWCRETLGTAGRPYIAVAPHPKPPRPTIAISLGTGENPGKRLPDPFEAALIEQMARRGADLWIDSGAGGEESERVAHATRNIPHQLWQGSFAGFAAIVAASNLYLGYDSAGQHVAAACHIPQITIFAGEPCEKMFQRWRPTGHDRIQVIRAKGHHPGEILNVISCAIPTLLA
jgi:ADP-heptose:LPS heptosyltransferase